MERKIIFSTNIEAYLKELVDILYEKKYFGFEEDARIYVQEIVEFILHYDFKVNVRKTDKNFKMFGSNFIKYKANNNTSWYIFFDKRGNQFLINHILNNHFHDFPDLL